MSLKSRVPCRLVRCPAYFSTVVLLLLNCAVGVWGVERVRRKRYRFSVGGLSDVAEIKGKPINFARPYCCIVPPLQRGRPV